MADPKAPFEWLERILRLASELGLTQAGLAERLGLPPGDRIALDSGQVRAHRRGLCRPGKPRPARRWTYFWNGSAWILPPFLEATFRRVQSSLKVNLHDFSLGPPTRFPN